MTAAPGWYSDPGTRAVLRWWDGVQWTASTQPLPMASSQVPSPQLPPQPQPVQAGEGGRARQQAVAEARQMQQDLGISSWEAAKRQVAARKAERAGGEVAEGPPVRPNSADRERPLESYDVVYKGGLRDLPKSKVGKIKMELYPDRIELLPTIGSKFWTELTIPFSTVSSLVIVERTLSTFESLAGGLNSRQLNQKNNIHVSYAGSEGPAKCPRLSSCCRTANPETIRVIFAVDFSCSRLPPSLVNGPGRVGPEVSVIGSEDPIRPVVNTRLQRAFREMVDELTPDWPLIQGCREDSSGGVRLVVLVAPSVQRGVVIGHCKGGRRRTGTHFEHGDTFMTYRKVSFCHEKVEDMLDTVIAVDQMPNKVGDALLPNVKREGVAMPKGGTQLLDHGRGVPLGADVSSHQVLHSTREVLGLPRPGRAGVLDCENPRRSGSPLPCPDSRFLGQHEGNPAASGFQPHLRGPSWRWASQASTTSRLSLYEWLRAQPATGAYAIRQCRASLRPSVGNILYSADPVELPGR